MISWYFTRCSILIMSRLVSRICRLQGTLHVDLLLYVVIWSIFDIKLLAKHSSLLCSLTTSYVRYKSSLSVCHADDANIISSQYQVNKNLIMVTWLLLPLPWADTNQMICGPAGHGLRCVSQSMQEIGGNQYLFYKICIFSQYFPYQYINIYIDILIYW